jgi:hypothetical protein
MYDYHNMNGIIQGLIKTGLINNFQIWITLLQNNIYAFSDYTERVGLFHNVIHFWEMWLIISHCIYDFLITH